MINKGMLRGKIYSKYNSASEFARDINWSRQRLHNILNGSKIPNVNEIKVFQQALQLNESELFSIFLPDRSQNT